ncbi:MAG: hypothetical protein F4X99_10780 [Gammaproteobacteria bacterium]|nr:hypothetical protein [Gammaproteobacteria bacterium]
MNIRKFPASHALVSGLLAIVIVAAAAVNRGAPEGGGRVSTDTILDGVAAEMSVLDRVTSPPDLETTTSPPASPLPRGARP